jgi:hypothetical protein
MGGAELEWDSTFDVWTSKEARRTGQLETHARALRRKRKSFLGYLFNLELRTSNFPNLNLNLNLNLSYLQ